jgi:acyl-CoA synthetase (NDP forming)
VPEVIEQCGARGIAAAVVFSSGFEETAEGRERAARLAASARAHDLLVIGPNCEGVWSVPHRVMLTFGSAANRPVLVPAPVAVLSQSGSVGAGVVRHLQDSGFGCNYFVSVGNETVLTILDVLDYLVGQEELRVVLLFVEGLRDGQRLAAIAERARRRGIQIVALKSGNSTKGGEAIASHTGKVATPYAVYRDVFAQAGILQVESLTQLLEAGEVLSTMPSPRRVGSPQAGLSVFSIPGGTRALTADRCQALGVPLATFAQETVARLSACLPEFGVPHNPTDITGQVLSDPGLFQQALAIIGEDPHTEALLVQLANRGAADARARRTEMKAVGGRMGVPVLVSFLGDRLADAERRDFAEDGLFCAADPADAVRYLSWLYHRRDAAALPPAQEATPPPEGARPLPADWGGTAALLAEAGIAMPPWRLLAPGEDPARVCRELRPPLVLKVLPEHAAHKTEGGLLRMGLASPAQVAQAAGEIRGRLGREDTPLLVQETVAGGLELVVAVTRNADFGALLAIGSGGILVELLEEIGYLALPVTEAQVERLLNRLKLARLLEGFRGSPRRDRAALVRAAVGLTRLFAAMARHCSELELNPLLVMPEGQGVVAVDVLIR